MFFYNFLLSLQKIKNMDKTKYTISNLSALGKALLLRYLKESHDSIPHDKNIMEMIIYANKKERHGWTQVGLTNFIREVFFEFLNAEDCADDFIKAYDEFGFDKKKLNFEEYLKNTAYACYIFNAFSWQDAEEHDWGRLDGKWFSFLKNKITKYFFKK